MRFRGDLRPKLPGNFLRFPASRDLLVIDFGCPLLLAQAGFAGLLKGFSGTRVAIDRLGTAADELESTRMQRVDNAPSSREVTPQ
ncbi:hypothetical protein USDA257_c04280 [Sinorhizobium fredii USDA 257]|uniref:Uncharacterized protein n=1 Tax=Sinorhizobium fredii (strain USDA 257) TaxID=1185652 RepID=I3WZG9_SINF2|nr:hypothetical protein USDA257_c04280 [Sinorhizobium fredii USDA 257]